MTGLVIAAVYLAMAAHTARTFVTRSIRSWEQEFRSGADDGDRLMFASIGILVGAVWPAYWVGRFVTGSLLASVPPSEKELRQQRDEAQRRIAALERDLGIGRSESS